MPRRILRRIVDVGSEGLTLIEMSIAMAGFLMVSAIMMSIVVGAARVDLLHSADDMALEQLRDARQRMSRDVREARRFTTAELHEFTVWIDEGWDQVVGPDELVTWRIDIAGNLWRTAGSNSRIEARGLSTSQSYFAFDAGVPSSATSMRLHLVVGVESLGEGADSCARALSTEITLRNVP